MFLGWFPVGWYWDLFSRARVTLYSLYCFYRFSSIVCMLCAPLIHARFMPVAPLIHACFLECISFTPVFWFDFLGCISFTPLFWQVHVIHLRSTVWRDIVDDVLVAVSQEALLAQGTELVVHGAFRHMQLRCDGFRALRKALAVIAGPVGHHHQKTKLIRVKPVLVIQQFPNMIHP